MVGDVRVVRDVGTAFAELVGGELRAIKPGRTFHLGCSGGASGIECFRRLAAEPGIPWGAVECYFADERCVEPESPDANAVAIAAALGAVRDDLAGFHPMSCTAGPDAYATLLPAGGLDLLQLGIGPDGTPRRCSRAPTAGTPRPGPSSSRTRTPRDATAIRGCRSLSRRSPFVASSSSR